MENNFKNTKDLVNHVFSLKRNINEIFRDRIYHKNFSDVLMDHLYQIDDIISLINVDVLLKTDLYKCLKPILGLSDLHFELKEACNRILNNIMKNVKRELFDNFDDLVILQNNKEDGECNNFTADLDLQILSLISVKDNSMKSGEEDPIEDMKDDCMIKTDSKYLNYIKRIEWNMFLESKRRIKTKRLENKEEDKNEIKIIEQDVDVEMEDFSLIVEKIEKNEKNEKNENFANNSNISTSNINIQPEEDFNINTKMLRSRNYSKTDVKTYYEILKECESVNKPIKTKKSKTKMKLEMGVVSEDG